MRTVRIDLLELEALRKPLDSEPIHGSPETQIAMPWPEFMERTRRVWKLTHAAKQRVSKHYARGLDTKPEDFA